MEKDNLDKIKGKLSEVDEQLAERIRQENEELDHIMEKSFWTRGGILGVFESDWEKAKREMKMDGQREQESP